MRDEGQGAGGSGKVGREGRGRVTFCSAPSAGDGRREGRGKLWRGNERGKRMGGGKVRWGGVEEHSHVLQGVWCRGECMECCCQC